MGIILDANEHQLYELQLMLMNYKSEKKLGFLKIRSNCKHCKGGTTWILGTNFGKLPDYRSLIRSIQDKEFPVCMTGAFILYTSTAGFDYFDRKCPAVLFVTGTEAEAIKLCADINAMSGENTAMYYPTKEILYTSVNDSLNIDL